MSTIIPPHAPAVALVGCATVIAGRLFFLWKPPKNHTGQTFLAERKIGLQRRDLQMKADGGLKKERKKRQTIKK